MSTWISFKQLRNNLRFAEVLEHYDVPFKMKGDRATAYCPLPCHQQRTNGKPRTASLSIHLARNIFQCFGCKASGNVLDFCCAMEGFNPSVPAELRQASLKIVEIFGNGDRQASQEQPVKDTGRTTTSCNALSQKKSNRQVVINTVLDFELRDLDPEHPYLRERGFTLETIRHFGLGYCNRGLMRGRIAIPLRDSEGQLVGYAGRLTKDSMISEECPKYLLPGTRERNGTRYEFHKSHFVYNGHAIQEPVNDLIVVEGFTSAWWLFQAGYRNVVGLMGSHCSEEQAGEICNLVAG